MTWRSRFLGVTLGAMSGALMAQQATSAPSTTTSTSGTQIVTGSVVQYSPGQSIVLRGADGKTSTYTIGPSVSTPADVEVGRIVTVSTESGTTGSQPVVTRIMVKESNPADTSPSATSAPSAWSGSPSGATGQFSPSDVSSPPPMSGSSGPSAQSPSSGPSSTSGASGQYSSGQSSTQSGSAGQSAGSGQSSDVPPSSGLSSGTRDRSDTSASATSFTGKVTAYEPKQSITIEQPGKGTVTYTIDAQSDLPQDVAVGKSVTITTRTVAGTSKPVVKTVTTTTRTMKMTTESHPQ